MGQMAQLDLDRQQVARITTPTRQLYSVAKLVGYCEAIAASGLVGDVMETKLRRLVAETLSAFNMEHHQP